MTGLVIVLVVAAGLILGIQAWGTRGGNSNEGLDRETLRRQRYAERRSRGW